MKYRYRFIVYLILVILTLLIAYILFVPKIDSTGYQSLSECFYEQPRISDIPYMYTLGTLVDCLEEKESNGNSLAVGQAGEIGCMQFMRSTFQTFCVERYGLPDDIWNCDIQKECADRMIADGGIDHWTTKHLCI